MTVIARRAVVRGRVQGVGFRYFAERTARQTGVRGWVRNLPDGSVETFVEGSEEAVRRYLEIIREGPRLGKVSAIEEEESAAAGHTGFEITP
jgi:acylphosphatase